MVVIADVFDDVFVLECLCCGLDKKRGGGKEFLFNCG